MALKFFFLRTSGANFSATLWKSKWEIHREDMERFREETRDLRVEYDREIAATRRFNRELLIRLEKTYANLNATMILVGDELAELKAAVRAQTEAIMKLVDRLRRDR